MDKPSEPHQIINILEVTLVTINISTPSPQIPVFQKRYL